MSSNPQHGYADIVVGLQYGDEGKARVVDMLAGSYDIVARFNGGANAGHTIETKEGGKVALNQIPSAIFHGNVQLYIGSGCVVNIETVAQEVEKIEALGVVLDGRLHISPQASVVQPHHVAIDSVTGGKIGTTKKGIGPCYSDKALRMANGRLANIKMGDLLEDPDGFFEIMEENLKDAAQKYDLDKANVAIDDPQIIIDNLKSALVKIKKFIQKDTLWLQKQVEQGKNVLFEGAQSVMLDVTKGSAPYVTSSSTIAAAAYTGGDLSPNHHRKTIGVAKAVMSRVGHGPFVSEYGGRKSEEYCMEANQDGSPTYGKKVEAEYNIDELIKSEDDFEMAKALRQISGEYGTVSTRPRRIGTLDLVQLNYAIRMNGVTDLFLTKCDILQAYALTFKQQLPLVTGYTLDGQEIDYVPGSTSAYYRVEGHTEYFDPFTEDLSEITEAASLPEALTDYLKQIESRTNTKIFGIGVGPRRDQYVEL